MTEYNNDTESKLLKLILEAGYECCSTVQSVRDLLDNVTSIEEKDVAEVLGSMARTHSNMAGVGISADSNNVLTEMTTWNVENFVHVVSDKAPELNWLRVYQCLDYPHFFLFDGKGLDLLVRAWKSCPSNNNCFPANVFFGKWDNVKGQLTALYQIAIAPTDLVNCIRCSNKTVIALDDFAQSSVHIRSIVSQLVTDQLNSLDLIERIIQLADSSVAEDAKALLEKILVKKVPELLFMGLLQIDPIANAVHQDLLNQLINFYLAGNTSSVLVMTKFWKVKPDLFKKNIIDLYSQEPTSLTRILAFVHELKILPTILDIQPFLFTIDLAALATRREYLNLEKWLQDKIKEHGVVFSQACLKFLSNKVRAELARQESSSAPMTVPLSMDVVNVFIKTISDSLSMQEKGLLSDIHNTYVQIAQKSVVSPPPVNSNEHHHMSPESITAAATTGDVTFKQDIEDEANSYYERIYSGEISIKDMIDKLTQFSTASDAREQDIFACMIHNLFDEYHFFPKYPDKELAITSILFGSLIQSQLVSYAPLGIALRCVLDALGNAPGSKMYNFGLQALAQFQSRLPEWPQYCAHLLQIPTLQQANPDLIHLIKGSMQMGRIQQHQQQQQLQQQQHLQHNEGSALLNESASTSKALTLAASSNNSVTAVTTPAPVIFAAIHVPPMSFDENIHCQVPNEATQDKILFIINNVALNNLAVKSSDLKENLQQSAYQWFSNYLVVKRASIEPNYHDLYILLLKSVNSSLLYQHVLRETFANIKILLNSDNTLSSSTERTLLKNLGSWLGGMTLAQNKPIVQKYIAFKELLLEGYDTNRLIVVIPFVCKVLEQGTKNSVFVPPNPWVMAILKLLVELYHNADLKLNLKFEIEVLCKSLSVELSSIKPTVVLKTRQPRGRFITAAPTTTAVVARPDDNGMDMNSPFGPASRPPIANLLPQSAADNDDDSAPINIPNLGPYLTFNPQIVMYNTQPNSKRWVLQAVTQAIREIIGPVVERSVAIASVSTRELVAKDFAMESDENKMRKAAHLMAQSLAGSLAMVTCKDPLRTSMVNHMRALFSANGLTEVVAEQAAMLTVADNLDLVCSVIEKTAMEKVVMEVDEALMSAYASRRKHREQQPRGSAQPYFDMNVLAMSRYPSTLLEPLRPKPNGLQVNQLRVYEDFTRIPRSAAAIAAASAKQMMEQQQPILDQQQRLLRTRPDMLPLNGYGSNNTNNVVPNFDIGNPQQQQQQQASAHQILERFAQYINELEKLVSMTNAPSFSALPMHHDIIVLVRQIPLLAMSSFDKAEAARTFAQKVVQLLYKSETQLGREMYVALLERLCDVAPNVGALVTSWLTHADDERKYNVPVTVALIKANLINLPEQDQELANLIDNGRVSAIDFTARLIRSCLFEDVPLANRQEFMASLEALSRLRGNVPDSVLLLMDDMRRRASAAAAAAVQPPPSSASNSSGAPTPLITQQLQQHEAAFQQQPPFQEEDHGLREHLRILFTEWVRIYQHPTTSDKVLNAFVAQLSQQGIFKMEDVSSLFYRVCLETSIEHAIKYKQLPGQSAGLAYQPIDAFSKLVISLLKLQQQQQQPPSTPIGTPATAATEAQDASRVSLFDKVLSIIVLVAAQHHEQRRQQFNQRPFLRLFTSLFSDLHAAEQQLQAIYIPILTAMSNTLHTLQPSQFPGFTFAWLQLISHRLFMPKLLLAENQKGWPTFQRLLICLFKFLGPFLRNTQLKDTTRMLYRGTLRVLLVLVHDFPEFLCDYHYSLCDVIPSSCIQLRNLILSAFPRSMRLPDPFTPNLKVDLLPEINQSPNILSDYTSVLKSDHHDLKKEIDAYLESGANDDQFLAKLPSRLMLPDDKTKYNIPMMNALVFYVGVVGVNEGIPINQGPPIEIFQGLLNELDSEGRYLFLSAIANQLRYPNSHTHYFSCVILYLFVESNKEIVNEQITRVLLERLIVNRPHPWGLLITFIELIKNPRYSFWNHSFTRCATDIERLFESVSRSINQI
ncbi:uncharacterized protein ATC70_010169 [Mucor velutinosus]|uniref:General negative regulator of transcription subunit 1 n=1 Tax=Mucor velutinosus TaxID=708070 RepID=A0AAN7DPT1_9FUNG|nr:hypothetical protein ATC70_010169 [Mucor velutinosus]